MKLIANSIFIAGGGSGIGRGLAALPRLGNTVIVAGGHKCTRLRRPIPGCTPWNWTLRLQRISANEVALAAQFNGMMIPALPR
jgi:hypothetical protein